MSDRVHVVFLGPSLDRESAVRLHPDAVFLPPAAMGDVLGAVRQYRPHAIGLVDGTFLSNMSVFHKELLYAMDQGSWVLGSSSMGALRAAECAEFGMVGVGDIYEAFASGELTDDDEVALTHADGQHGWKGVSDALVSIRAALAQAVEAGVVDSGEAELLLQSQKSRWFPERRLSSLPVDAQAMGIEPARVAALRALLRTGTLRDPKRDDAIALLAAMRELPDARPAAGPGTVHSSVFRAALARDVPVQASGGFTTTFDRIRRYAALHENDYAEIMAATRMETAVMQLALAALGEPDAEDEARGRAELCERWGVTDAELEGHAAGLDLDPDALDRLVFRLAVLSRLSTGFLGNSWYGMSTEHFLNELRLRGRYASVKAAAALTESAASVVTSEDMPSSRSLIASHSALTGWPIPEDLQSYVRENDLGSGTELLQTLWTSIRAHQALFGVGLVVNSSDDTPLIDHGDPMMPRGR